MVGKWSIYILGLVVLIVLASFLLVNDSEPDEKRSHSLFLPKLEEKNKSFGADLLSDNHSSVEEEKVRSDEMLDVPVVCDDVLSINRDMTRSVSLPDGYPEAAYNYQGTSHKEGLGGLTYEAVREISKQCREWEYKLDRALWEQSSQIPLSKESIEDISQRKRACNKIHQRGMRQLKIDGIQIDDSALGGNRHVSYRFQKLMKQGEWQELIDLIKSGDIPANYRLTLAKGLEVSDSTILASALSHNIPHKYLRQLLDLNVTVTPRNFYYATRRGTEKDVHTDLVFLEEMSKRGADLTKVYEGYHLPSNLLGNMTQSNQKVVLGLLEELAFDVNDISVGREDILSIVIKKQQQGLKYGLKINHTSFQWLLDRGAQVTASHLALVKDPDLKRFLMQKKCVVSE